MPDLRFTQGAIEVGEANPATPVRFTQGAVEVGIFEYNNLIVDQCVIEVGFPGPSWPPPPPPPEFGEGHSNRMLLLDLSEARAAMPDYDPVAVPDYD